MRLAGPAATDGIASTLEQQLPEKQDLPAKIRNQCTENISGAEYYLKLAERGVQYGPFFQSIAQLWRHDADMLGEVSIPAEQYAKADAYQLHPALLDACLQVQAAAIAIETAGGGRDGIYFPTHIDEIRLQGRPGPHLWSHARLQEPKGDSIRPHADVFRGDVQLIDDAGYTVAEILGLRFDYLGSETQPVVRENPQNLNDWLYELQWQPLENVAPHDQSKATPGSWLIFADRGGVGEALARRLEAHGQRSIRVAAGESYEHSDGDCFRIRPERPEDFRKLFETVFAPEQPACRGIVHLWSLDVPLKEPASVAALEAAETQGCGSVLPLVQELALSQPTDPPRLWLVTDGAQAAQEEPAPLAIAQTPLWGLGRVIAHEHPMLWGGLIDLEPGFALEPGVRCPRWRRINCGGKSPRPTERIRLRIVKGGDA